MKSNVLIRRLVMASLLSAIACVATLFVQIPIPATNGYLNFGDGIVLLSGWLLGPAYGAVAAGLGTALADVVTGYVQYAPATFLIKAAMAALAAFTVKKTATKAIGATLAEIWMVLGYFLYESALLGYGVGGAVAGVPFNVLQGAFGVVVSMLLHFALGKILRGRDIFSL